MKVVRLVAAGTAAGLIVMAVFAAGDGLRAQQTSSGEVWLRGAGSTFAAALYKKWIEAYHARHPDVSVSYDDVGSGEGMSRFVAGSAATMSCSIS